MVSETLFSGTPETCGSHETSGVHPQVSYVVLGIVAGI